MPRQRERGAGLPGILAQALKFGAVGAVGLVVNLLVFNALRLTVFSPAVVPHGPLYAVIVATVLAIVANWLGNRYWAFHEHRARNTVREGVEFFAVSLVGMLIPLACLWISHYLLGFTSLLADNVANNVVGLALGTVFRFALYRWWVFAPQRAGRVGVASEAAGIEHGGRLDGSSPESLALPSTGSGSELPAG